ncbi:MAG: DUF6691 family protein [Bdellovibrionales bacterium]
MSEFAAFVSGALFAAGLALSGMTQPQKVVGFLNVAGNWDPSLMFVMVGAIGIHLVAFRFLRKKAKPIFGSQWHVPTRRDLTPSLIVGAILFGAGWGLGGYCPGPALTSLASLEARPYLFVGSMIAGMAIYQFAQKKMKWKP